VDASLFTGADFIDLQGSVVTPGLIDGHFHVSSWAKKLPDEGQRFGYYPDIGDPQYYVDPATDGRRSTRAAMEAIVTDANLYLVGNRRQGVYMHGYHLPRVADPATNGAPDGSCLFTRSAMSEYNTNYLLNMIGSGAGANFKAEPAVMVQTSGQSCWYNGALLEEYNRIQQEVLGTRFPPTPLDGIVPPTSADAQWEFHVRPNPPGETNLFARTTPFSVDLVVPATAPEIRVVHVPFEIIQVDETNLVVFGKPLLMAITNLVDPARAAETKLIPFYRPIPAQISTQVWNEAALFNNAMPEGEGLAYGNWNPREPHTSNWYNGAERGLVQYAFDDVGGVWRPSGFAEHYVMRDQLSAVVLPPATTEDNVRFRRNLARWCHRHGITAVQDIMFYRRRYNPEEFLAYEALSYQRSLPADDTFFTSRKLPSSMSTGRYYLRVGLYYYLEQASDMDEVLSLALTPEFGFDPNRLQPPDTHPEYPGWVRWLGWKLQLDGAFASRNAFSSAPLPKILTSDACTITNELGQLVTFRDHGYGLLTETDEQEQVFTSRETAALY
jgi:hypothetical protein